MKDSREICERAFEHLQRIADGEPGTGLPEPLRRHLESCPDCRTLAAGMRVVDTAMAARFTSVALAASFDRTVLERIDGLSQRRDSSQAARRAEAERDRLQELAWVRKQARRYVQHAFLNLAGLGAVLWAAGRLVPRLMDWAGNMGAAVPGAEAALAAGVLAAVAVASALAVTKTASSAAPA